MDGLFFQGSGESLNLQKKAKKQLAQAVPGILNNPAVTSGAPVVQPGMQSNQVSSRLTIPQNTPEELNKKKLKSTMRDY